jgi:hypothetical protein
MITTDGLGDFVGAVNDYHRTHWVHVTLDVIHRNAHPRRSVSFLMLVTPAHERAFT